MLKPHFLAVMQQVRAQRHNLLTSAECAGDPRQIITNAQHLNRTPRDFCRLASDNPHASAAAWIVESGDGYLQCLSRRSCFSDAQSDG